MGPSANLQVKADGREKRKSKMQSKVAYGKTKSFLVVGGLRGYMWPWVTPGVTGCLGGLRMASEGCRWPRVLHLDSRGSGWPQGLKSSLGCHKRHCGFADDLRVVGGLMGSWVALGGCG
jgi:hypothetical protein